MSCFHRDRDLSDGKIGEESGIGSCRGIEGLFTAVEDGNMASRWICVAARRSGKDDSASKSISG